MNFITINMDSYYIYESNRKNKRFVVLTPENRWLHFMAAAPAQSYLEHGDAIKKRNWEARHSTNKNWENINSAIWWARYIGWNKKTLKQSMIDIKKKFNIKVYFVE